MMNNLVYSGSFNTTAIRNHASPNNRSQFLLRFYSGNILKSHKNCQVQLSTSFLPHSPPQVRLITFLLTAPFQSFNPILLLWMLCPVVRKKEPQLISSGLVKSSPITPTEYQQHF